MKFEILFELKNAFEKGEFNSLKGEKFTYALSKNENKINSYVKQCIRNLTEANKETIQKYNEYTKKVDEVAEKIKNKENDKLIEELSKKLENKDISEEEKIKIEEDLKSPKEIQKQIYDEIEKELSKFNKENQDIIKNYRELDKKFKEMMDEEIKFEYYKIKRSNIPNEISYEQRKLIQDLILDDILDEN